MDYFDKQEITRMLASLKNEAVTKCIISLANQERSISAFSRGLRALLSARNPFDLTSVESAFQLAIDEISNLKNTGYKSWTAEKTGLYLFALQYIILHLNEIELPYQKQNTYKPKLVTSINEIDQKCRDLGVSPKIMHEQCYSTEYKFPEVAILSNFELFEVNRANDFKIRLEKYKTTHKKEDLYEVGTYHKLSKQNLNVQQTQTELTQNQYQNLMEGLIRHMKRVFLFADFDLKTYNENYIKVNNEIRKLWKMSGKDIKAANNAIKSFHKYLIEKENNPIVAYESGKNSGKIQ